MTVLYPDRRYDGPENAAKILEAMFRTLHFMPLERVADGTLLDIADEDLPEHVSLWRNTRPVVEEVQR